MSEPIIIYTDGSCNAAMKLGAWAAIIQINNIETVLKGIVEDTTHQRMELFAVLNALDHLIKTTTETYSIEIFTDSQYVVKLIERKDKLIAQQFITKKNTEIVNKDMLLLFFKHLDAKNINFNKVKAHQKSSRQDNLNRRVDMLCRKLLRDNIHNSIKK